MWKKPKDVKLDFLTGQQVCGLNLGLYQSRLVFCDEPYVINFSAGFTLNKKFYDRDDSIKERHKLVDLIGKKVTSAQFIDEIMGDLKLTFDSGDELIIHEDDAPYESYTMQTPEGLVVV